MGVGASNLSSSDLSVYQSSLTKITQNLVNSTNNASGINLKSEQIINFTNGPAEDNITAMGCNPVIRNATNDKCVEDCKDYFTMGLINREEWKECKDDCTTNALKLYPSCSTDMIQALTPTINCGNIDIKQFSSMNSSLVQVAENQVNATMTTDVSNSFESVIDKTISQTNKDLNFMQFNSSNERTSMSQSVRNDILNSINNTASNLSSTTQDNKQIITFENEGYINCTGCVNTNDTRSQLMPKTVFPTGVVSGNCSLTITQENIQTAAVNQKASAAMVSTFNNTVANNLASKYKLDVSQTNDGVSLMDLLLPFIIILVAIIAIGFIGGYVLKGLTAPIMKNIGRLILVLGTFGGILVLGLALGCELVPTWPSYCPANHKEEPSSGTATA